MMPEAKPTVSSLRRYAALGLRALPASLAMLLTLQPARAQTAAPASAAGKAEEIVKMSSFEVRTTAGTGYSNGNSASAMKTSESLMNLPAQVIVITNDMVRDIGSNNASDILAYGGLVPFYRGPAIISRGNRVGNPYTDDVPQNAGIGISDNTNIDTYQVIKGPQQVLYPLASLGGLVLQTTKKPLPNLTQYSTEMRVQQWGRTRTTLDFNQPLADVGGAKITGRILANYQAGDGAFYNVKDNRMGIFPMISVDWKDTTLVIQYDAQVYQYLPGGTGILTPDGGIYTGLGNRNMNTPPQDYDDYQLHNARIIWTQRLSSNWQVKSQVTYFNAWRIGSAGFPTTVNWNNNTVTYTIRKDDGFNSCYNVQTDAQGNYTLGGLKMTSSFGFNVQEQNGYSKFLTTVPTQTIPIGNEAAINGIVFPPRNSYPPLANGNIGSRSIQNVYNGYFMQSVDVIKDTLTLVGGMTYGKIETITDTSLLNKAPFTAVDQPANEWLHRYAAIWKINKEVSLYFSNATTFNPPVGPDKNNIPLAPVKGTSSELGFKTAFMDGRISISAAVYDMKLTNQAILAQFPALNTAGINYYIPIGDTKSKGWDASFALLPVPGLQIVGTAYQGTVRDFNDNTITGTVENSWSLFTRYDFNPADKGNALHGLAFGGGAQRAGGKWFTMAGMVLPGGKPLPLNSSGNPVFKLKQEVLMNLFAEYQFNKNWSARLDCVNALDKSYAVGAQGVGLGDPVDPRTFSLTVRWKM